MHQLVSRSFFQRLTLFSICNRPCTSYEGHLSLLGIFSFFKWNFIKFWCVRLISRRAHAPIHRDNVWRLKEEKQIDESNIYPISRRGTLRVLFHMSRLFDLINPLRGLRNEQRPIDDVPSPKFRVFGQNMCNVRVTGGLIIPWIRKSASLNFGQQLKYCRPAEPVTSIIWNSYFVGASTITRVTGHSFSPSPGCH